MSVEEGNLESFDDVIRRIMEQPVATASQQFTGEVRGIVREVSGEQRTHIEDLLAARIKEVNDISSAARSDVLGRIAEITQSLGEHEQFAGQRAASLTEELQETLDRDFAAVCSELDARVRMLTRWLILLAILLTTTLGVQIWSVTS